MHFYFMTRAEQARTESFMKFMQAQMFPWKRKNLKTGKNDVVGVQELFVLSCYGNMYFQKKV